MTPLQLFLRRLFHARLLAGLFFVLGSCSALTQATQQQPPVGAVSLEALRQGYLDAAQSKQAEKLDALFEWSGVSPKAHAAALKHFAEDFNNGIASATIRDAIPADTEHYTKADIHFSHPVLKVFEVKFLGAQSGSTTFFVGRCGIGYCLVNALMEPGPQPQGGSPTKR